MAEKIEGRIDGEFHYVTWDVAEEFDYDDGTFELHRKSDNEQLVKWFYGPEGPEADGKSALKAFDATYTEGRREALAEVKTRWVDLSSALIAVSPFLSKPFKDDPRWTPWTRFVEKPLERLNALLSIDKDGGA